MDVLHFEEVGRVNPAPPDARLPEATYQSALDHLVFACTDIVFVHNQAVLLGKRKHPPRDSWWIVGGRMAAGEHPKEAARRKATQEAGLEDVALDRFQCIGVYSTCFATRHQPPSHHGSHSLNITYRLEVTPAEKARLTLRSDEYETWEWLELSQAKDWLNIYDPLDQALWQVLRDATALSSSSPF